MGTVGPWSWLATVNGTTVRGTSVEDVKQPACGAALTPTDKRAKTEKGGFDGNFSNDETTGLGTRANAEIFSIRSAAAVRSRDRRHPTRIRARTLCLHRRDRGMKMKVALTLFVIVAVGCLTWYLATLRP